MTDRRNRKRTYTPEQIKANSMINNLVKAGRIKRPNVCSVCGKTSNKIQSHHPDPKNKSLLIVWCCQKCHLDLEKGNIQATPAMETDCEPFKARVYTSDKDGNRKWHYKDGYSKKPVSEATKKKMSDSQKRRRSRHTSENDEKDNGSELADIGK